MLDQGEEDRINLVPWCWGKDQARHLVVVNLSGDRSQTQVTVPWDDLAGRSWQLTDTLTGTVYDRDGSQMRSPGLYVDLERRGYLVFELAPIK